MYQKVKQRLNDKRSLQIAVAVLTISMTLVLVFCVGGWLKESSTSAKDRVCQQHFGEEYVWHYRYFEGDHCVNDREEEKTPKIWNRTR